jgi:hypothetical protein
VDPRWQRAQEINLEVKGSKTSWDVCERGNKKFVKTNDLKQYLNSVSGVDNFWVTGHFERPWN